MQQQRIGLWLKLMTIVLLISSCQSDPLDVNTSDVEVSLELKRFEDDLFQPPNDTITMAYANELSDNYGDFFKHYTEDILNLGTPRDPALVYNLNRFIHDADVRKVFTDCKKKYKGFLVPFQEILNGFIHYRYYFPDKNIPTVTTYFSGFNYAVAVTDSNLGIGLDMYLGKDYPLYERIGFPKYKSNKMTEERLPIDALRAWISTEFEKPRTENLLEEMLYEGKVLYALEAMFPSKPDSLIAGYTAPQSHWLEENVHQMWGFFIREELFFAQEYATITKFIGDGPFTSGLGKESPPRTGVWLGWQIVRAYMEEHPGTKLEQLFDDTNSQAFLAASKYKPKT